MGDIRDKIVHYSSMFVFANGPLKIFRQKLVNYILALLYPLHPERLSALPGLVKMSLRYWLSFGNRQTSFPPIESALIKPDGLLSIGGKFNTRRLLLAYREGIYPHCHIGPIKWYAPSERMVLFLNEMHIGKNLRWLLRRKQFRVTFDQAFREVIIACSEPRRGKTPLTWITKKIAEAYCRLYEEGYAHSVEVWDDDGYLVGGLCGISIGRIFFNESMFARKPDTSKLALAFLNCHLQAWGYVANDMKGYTKFWENQGARMIKRDEFTELLRNWRDVSGQPSPWKVDETLNVGYWKPKEGISTAVGSH